MNDDMIVPIDTKEGCQKATSDLDVDQVIEEEVKSQPKGCYMYTSENELFFNKGDKETGEGLAKTKWTDGTRKVCRDFEVAMSKSGGKSLGEYSVVEILPLSIIHKKYKKLNQQFKKQSL